MGGPKKLKDRMKQGVHQLLTRRQADRRGVKRETLARLVRHLRRGGELKVDEDLGCLFALAWSNDGNLLASTSAKCTQIWDTDRNKLLHDIQDHTEIVTTFLWSNTQKATKHESMFVTASLDTTIRLYKDYQCVGVLKDHKDWIRCLALSPDDSALLSGCVSSAIMGWDVNRQKPVWRIKNAHSFEHREPGTTHDGELDTINCLSFSHFSNNNFISGARDGLLKLWDRRTLPNPAWTIRAHNGKVNCAEFSVSDRHILSSGRDNCIRLWDVRKISDFPDSGSSAVVMEYDKHVCGGYNIFSTFFNDERNIVTGSEDKKFYIYDTFTGQVVKKLKPPKSQVIHLVHPRERQGSLEIASSSIENLDICLWKPVLSSRAPTRTSDDISMTEEKSSTEHITLNVNSQTDSQGDATMVDVTNRTAKANSSSESSEDDTMATNDEVELDHHRIAAETLMQRYGDQILEVFHSNNMTFTSVDWESLIGRFLEQNQNNSQNFASLQNQTDVMQILVNMSNDIERAMAYCEEGNDPDTLEEFLDNQNPSESLFSSIGRRQRDVGRIGERILGRNTGLPTTTMQTQQTQTHTTTTTTTLPPTNSSPR